MPHRGDERNILHRAEEALFALTLFTDPASQPFGCGTMRI